MLLALVPDGSFLPGSPSSNMTLLGRQLATAAKSALTTIFFYHVVNAHQFGRLPGAAAALQGASAAA
jgi:hypothetical protein